MHPKYCRKTGISKKSKVIITNFSSDDDDQISVSKQQKLGEKQMQDGSREKKGQNVPGQRIEDTGLRSGVEEVERVRRSKSLGQKGVGVLEQKEWEVRSGQGQGSCTCLSAPTGDST